MIIIITKSFKNFSMREAKRLRSERFLNQESKGFLNQGSKRFLIQ